MSGNGRRSGEQETFGSSGKKYLQDRYHEERSKDDVQLPWEGTNEDPLGEEEVELPYLGWTRLFSEHQNQVGLGLAEKGMGGRFLKHHVPLTERGTYKLLEFPGEYGERQGPGGYALCCATTQTHNSKGEQIREHGNPCRAKAINRSGYCSRHGGALHPLDRKRIDWDKAPRHIRFKYGKLPVTELDDEELSRGQIRKEDGSWTSNQFVSAEIHDQMVKQLFERSDEMMRNSLLTAVNTFSEIAAGTAYEPSDRLQAAKFIFQWLRGSTPVKVDVSVEAKPFEQVLEAVFTGGSRAKSRARRGLEGEDIMDAEIVEGDELELPDLGPMLDEGQDEEDGDYEETPRYDSVEDQSLARDLAPKPVIHHGPAGYPTTDVPPNLAMGYTQQAHDERVEQNKKEAEENRSEFFKKRKDPRLIAEERKAQQEKLKAGYAERKGAIKRGFSDVDKPLEGNVEQIDEKTIQVNFKSGGKS